MNLTQSLSKRPGAKSGEAPGECRPQPEPLSYPLSFGQERLWFIEQLQPGTAVYNMADVWRIHGSLDQPAFEWSIHQIIRRHEVLRARVAVADGRPVQTIPAFDPATIPVIDLTEALDPELEARQVISREVGRPFNLERGPLFHVQLLRLGDREHAALFIAHHIVCDGWSVEVFRREFGQLYPAALEGRPSPLAAPAMQYAEFAASERSESRGAALDEHLDYWRTQLKGPLPALELPTDKPRPVAPSFRGAVEFFSIDPALARDLRALSRNHGATPFMTLLAAFKVLLQRYTSQDDILVGAPIAGRDRVETRDLIGFFVNTLPLRTRLDGDPSFLEALERVRTTTLDACVHQGIPFERIVRELQPERSPNRNPLFQVLFSYEGNTTGTWTLPGLSFSRMEIDPGTAKFDWSIVFQEREEGLRGAFEYSTDLFDPDTIRRVLANFRTLLEGIIANPGGKISQLPLLAPGERQQVVFDWNRTLPAPGHRLIHCLHDFFEAQEMKSPDDVALIDGRERLSYGDLNGRANRLARHLRRLGASPGVPIAICMERSWRLVVALLGVLKAGAAYVPMDPAYPAERLEWILEDSKARVFLTQNSLSHAPHGRRARMVCLDADWPAMESDSGANLAPAARSGDLAYIIYTSGSTGRPKGVALEHRSAASLMEWARRAFQPEELAGVLASTSICFDLSVFEIFAPLSAGGTVILAENALALPDLPAAQSVTLINTVPSAIRELLRTGSIPPSVQVVNLAGEFLGTALVNRIYAETRARKVFDLYGPTETTTYSSMALRKRDEPPTIGRPLENTEIYVLDDRGQPVPIGVRGEIHIGGDGVARGYWNRPELTAEKFIPHPFHPGARAYRTGDLGRWRADGNLVFLGRRDSQVKILGFRVEPGETEAVLGSHPGIRECAVAVRENGSGRKRLVGYFVPGSSPAPAAQELKRFLQAKLPAYQVPSAFVELAALPLMANGKVNLSALPAPADGVRLAPSKGSAAPRDAVELKLAEIWENVLGVHPVGIDDKFFDLGGHSLLAVELISQIERVFGRKLLLSTIFQTPTIERLAEVIRQKDHGTHNRNGTSLVEIQSRGDGPPLYLVHGAGGGMFWGYANLSRHIGVPIYALKSRGMDGRDEFSRIEDMASLYVADIRAAQPRGPYYLGGYCFGGVVAFEMARQLRAKGETVALLALLNSSLPNSRYDRVRWTPAWGFRFLKNFVYWMKRCRQWSPSQRREFVRWKRESLRRGWLRILRNRSASTLLDPGNLVDLSSYSPEQRRLWQVHIRALAAYRPGAYAGRVQLFRSPGHQLLCSYDPDYGWGELAKEGVEITVVPGVHEKILEEPCVKVVAQELGEALDRCRRAGAEPADAGPEAAISSREADLDYWRRRLEGAPALIELPSDRPRPARLGAETAREPVVYAAEFRKALESFAEHTHSSARLVLLAGFQALLSRYTGLTDIVVGSAESRGRALMPLRGNFPDDPTLPALVEHLKTIAQEAEIHGGVTLDAILTALDVRRDESHAPVFQVSFLFDSGRSAGSEPDRPGPGSGAAPPPDLQLVLGMSPEGVSGHADYSPALFDRERIVRLFQHFRTLLESAFAEPEKPISALLLLPEPEARRVLEEWNATDREYPAGLTLADLFEQQVQRSPDAVALVARNERIRYRELNARANQIAHRLRAFGIGPESLVAVCLERSPQLIAALLGVLKAGGAYVPMDPAYPTGRLEFILEDTKAPVLLTRKSLAPRKIPGATRLLCLDSESDVIAAQCAENPFSGVEANQLAYVIYTSGSTGKPKGVALEHRNAAALIHWAKDVFNSEDLAGVLAATSVCFDLSVFELFVTLSWGGKVILAENALALPSLPAAGEVTLVNTVPSAIRELLRIGGIPSSVRVINLAGEPLTPPLVDLIYAETRVQKVHDLYGPSETTTYSTYALRRANSPATIGRPLANERVFLLDGNLQPVPIGVPGEIHIGGAGVARAYLNRPELTAEKFIPDPSRPGARIYRTGDYARWRADGNLEFLGRKDQQIKLRGFRIELGEIEAALRGHPSVREALVLVREDRPGDQRLVAYVVVHPDRQVSLEELRQFIHARLPEHLAPSAFVVLPRFPLTPNGKVDRRALPAPEPDRQGASARFVAPQGPVEKQLASIWGEVLGLKEVGAEDNFFELGGHSLLAIQVISRIREALKIELPLAALFDSPTVAALAKGVQGSRWGRGTQELPVNKAPRHGPLPVAFVQEQLWFFEQIQPDGYAYNMPAAFRLRGSLDRKALQAALDAIVHRHEALRTAFRYENGELRQVIGPPAPVTVDEMPESAEAAPDPDREQSARQWLHAFARRPFNMARGPLLRAGLARVGAEEHFLIVVAHHSVFDGWSWAIFFGELGRLYDAFSGGAPAPALPELAFQYADFARWRRNQMTAPALDRELDYWRKRLSNAPASVDLPTDREEPAALSTRAETRSVALSKEITQALGSLSHQEASSPFMVLMTALAITFKKWTQQQDMVFGTVVAGRNRREWENVIGCFMNFLPIRLTVAGDETGRELLLKVRSSVLEAQAHQECPFEKIVESINPRRRLNQNPLYNVALLLQNFPAQAFSSDALKVSRIPIEAHAPLVDLRFEAVEDEHGLSLLCEYTADLFDGTTIERLLSSYAGILERLVRNPEVRLSELSLSSELTEQMARSRARRNEQTIAVTATFTAEPVEESLEYWMRTLEIPARIRFAPFNQVFQQLLHPGSLLATNPRGLNVVLVRLEDWRNSAPAGGAGSLKDVERAAREFISAVKTASARPGQALLIVLCPASARAQSEPEFQRLVLPLEEDIAREFRDSAVVEVVTSGRLFKCYPVPAYDDPRGNELGRVPYSPVLFTALGTLIARKLSARLRAPHKVIALDCDQTLWSGVCGEDEEVVLDPPRRALQEFMRAQHEAGRLLVLCSKNNEQDVEAVFSRRSDLPLRRHHFTARRLNWRAKSDNLKSLAAELNLGLDSFIFVDDNPLECADVEAHCPEVLVLQLPQDTAEIPRFLEHCWVFDRQKLTIEDRRRGQMYQESLRREQLRNASSSLADFISGLNLQIQIEPVAENQLVRASQLTQRTNQFNCTTVRRGEDDFRRLAGGGAKILAVSVRDRFGDYGMTGLACWSSRGQFLDVETFLLSCRVLGRGVEHAVLSRLGNIALETGHPWVDVRFHASPRNKPARDFLESVGAGLEQPLNGGSVYRFPAAMAAGVRFDPARPGTGAIVREPGPEMQAPGSRKFARCRDIALESNDPGKIHEAIEAAKPVRPASCGESAQPRTDLERTLAGIWRKLLRIDRLGITDNFFELGGHSLLAVRLFSELEQATGRKLPLVTIFQAPTIEQLARVLEQEAGQRPTPLVPVQANGERPPLFLVHGAGGDVLWGYANLASHMRADQPIYGIKSRGQVGLDEYDRIEDMARYYLEEIRAFQPQGPYYLGGYCFGGNVAYEMARQLEAQGERAALVALLDASPCNAGYEKMPWWRPAFALRFLLNLSWWLIDFARLSSEERRRYFTRKARVLRRKLAGKLRRQKRPPAEVDLEQVIDPAHFPERELKFWRVHLRAAETHVEQPYAGHVTLIRTRGQPLFCSLEEDFCWSRLASGGVEVRRIPGSHENIFLEPNVRSLAAELNACLDDAQSREGAANGAPPAVRPGARRPASPPDESRRKYPLEPEKSAP